MFPILHLGRPWLAYWLFPYPNTMGVQPNFRSPLVWDVFAVSTYATVSLLFWYVRTDARTWPRSATARTIAWRASFTASWRWDGVLRPALGGLRNGLPAACRTPTPLVLSVHTVVELRLHHRHPAGMAQHLLPAYFVAGAIYSGFAMVLALAIPLRAVYGLEGLITDKHLDNSAKVMLATGLIVGYAYILEAFSAWYSGNVYEMAAMWNRMTGLYKYHYWTLVFCNIVAPNVLWFKRVRSKPALLFVSSMVVLVGMWLERFVIIVSSLAQDTLPAAWRKYEATRWDWATYLGTIGLFLFLFFLLFDCCP
jgi:molybdopterin-containing oxidoreductase family membrane subunit